MRYIESINQALHSLMERDASVIVMGEDILDPYGGAFKATKGLSSAFPQRVITTPISEAAITGFAIGMSMRGLKPILEIMFGDFLTLCTDQIVNGASKFNWMYNGKSSAPVVIRTPMGGRRGYGPTHSQTLEALFLNVPGIKIIAPSHFHNPGVLLEHSVVTETEPVIFIENKALYPCQLQLRAEAGKAGAFYCRYFTDSSQSFPSAVLNLDGNDRPDITLVSYGGMALQATDAAFKTFMEDEICVEVIIPALIKPFPVEDVLNSAYRSGRIIIAEESVMTAGWGAEFSAQIYERAFEKLKKPIKRIGAKECPIPASKSLESQVLPQTADLVAAIRDLYMK